MRLPLMLLLALLAAPVAAKDRTFELTSPDRRLAARVTVGDRITFSLAQNGKEVLAPTAVSLNLEGGRQLGVKGRFERGSTRSVNQEIAATAYKKARITDRFNELRLAFRDGYALVFRAYDEGLAYRWETTLPGTIRVTAEQADFALPGDPEVVSLQVNTFNHPYEDLYTRTRLSSIADSMMLPLPALFLLEGGARVAITESDLEEYAALYFRRSRIEDRESTRDSRPSTLESVLPPFPLAEDPGGHMRFTNYVTRTAPYVAESAGTRTFPWRVMIVADTDRELLDSDLVYTLARPPEAGQDFSWVKPGKVMWDWWHATMLRGVPFKSGINTETYKYYIDFAARNGIEYINLDEGWSDQFDLLKVSPAVDVPAIVAYGRENGVDVILWCVARTLDAQLEPALDQFQSWGVRGIKVDFMQRDDQPMVGFYHRVAREAARRRIHVNFHGAYKPTGMNRAWPNVVNHEAVRGLEYNKFNEIGTTPGYAATLPFTRALAGYMDYTPGAMVNAQKEDWRANNRRPMSQGTRSAQLALYVVLYGPLQMLSDAPYRYEAEPEILDYLRRVPTTWDDSAPVAGEVGQYAVVARRKGDTWYLGAINNEQARRVEVDLNFLTEGNWGAEIYRDGPNASQLGEDYLHEVAPVNAGRKMTLDMAPGGGFVAILRPMP